MMHKDQPKKWRRGAYRRLKAQLEDERRTANAEILQLKHRLIAYSAAGVKLEPDTIKLSVAIDRNSLKDAQAREWIIGQTVEKLFQRLRDENLVPLHIDCPKWSGHDALPMWLVGFAAGLLKEMSGREVYSAEYVAWTIYDAIRRNGGLEHGEEGYPGLAIHQFETATQKS